MRVARLAQRANSGDLNSNESKAFELQLIYHILKPTDYHGESATDVQPGRRAPGSAHSSRSLPGVPGSYAVGKRVSMDLYTCSGTARRPVLVVWTMSSVTSELRWCLNSIFLPSWATMLASRLNEQRSVGTPDVARRRLNDGVVRLQLHPRQVFYVHEVLVTHDIAHSRQVFLFNPYEHETERGATVRPGWLRYLPG